MEGLFSLVWRYAQSDPLPAATLALMAACIAYLGALQASYYAWYFVVFYVVLAFSLAAGHPIAFCVFVVGTLGGLAEFLGKFKDEPIKALRTGQALTYLTFNGLIAVFAYTVMVAYGAPAATLLEQIQVVVVAGLGSMLIMRSRLFNVKIGEEDYAFGPDQIVRVYLRFMEKAIDRVRADDRFTRVRELMEGISFGRVYTHALVSLDSAQAITPEDYKKLVENMEKLKIDKLLTSQEKANRLGYLLLNEMGEEFLETVFGSKGLPKGARIRAPAPPAPSSLPSVLQGIPFLGGPHTENYMAFASNMSFTRLRERLGWENVDAAQVRAAIAPQKCELKGYRLVFNVADPDDPTRAVSNIVADPNGKVEGVVYRLTPEAIEFLDSTEQGYQRIDVYPAVGKKEVKAWAYASAHIEHSLRPSAAYVERLVIAAREAGLDTDYINALQNTPTA